MTKLTDEERGQLLDANAALDLIAKDNAAFDCESTAKEDALFNCVAIIDRLASEGVAALPGAGLNWTLSEQAKRDIETIGRANLALFRKGDTP